MASPFVRNLIVCVFLVALGINFSSCLASRQSSPQSSYQEGECNNDNLNPVEPKERINHEGGYTFIWDENDLQLRCVGAAVSRHVIQTKGVLVPSFNNAPGLVFVLRGKGVLGVVYPGCAETFQSSRQSGQQGKQKQQPGQQGKQQQHGQGESADFRDQHQKVQELVQGDVIALDTGVAHWAYNEANEELDLLVVHDVSSRQNQLDPYLRRFFFAGNNPQGEQGQQGQQGKQGQQKPFGFNFFQALDTEVLARAFGVRQEVIEKLKNPKGSVGFIVKAKEELGFARSIFEERPRREQQQQPEPELMQNGLEETICTVRIKENLFNPERADIYSAEGGSISTLNSYNIPILQRLRLSAGRGRLRPNAIVAPYWNMDAHSISLVTEGSGRVQIVGESRKPLFDGEIKQGQLLIVPQNFVHFKQAGQQGLEWVTVKTNANAKTSAVLGKTSVFRGVPLDVWVNIYQLSREEAQALKYNRDEVTILQPHFTPESEGQQGQKGRSDQWSIL